VPDPLTVGSGKEAIHLASSAPLARSTAPLATSPERLVSTMLSVVRSDGRGEELEVIQPSRENRLELATGAKFRVLVDLRQADAGRAEMGIVERATFELHWAGNTSVKISNQRIDVAADEVSNGGRALAYELEVLSGAPVGNGTLSLLHVERSKRGRILLAEVDILGAYHPPPKEIAEYFDVDLDPVPNESIVVVHVAAAAADDRFTVRVFHPSVELRCFEVARPGKHLVDTGRAIDVYRSVWQYSSTTAGEVAKSLDTLIKEHFYQLSIVVLEYLDSRVPWEMLILNADGDVLGASARVVRWAPVRYFGDPRRIDPLLETELTGRVFRLVDAKHLENVDAEDRELGDCDLVTCKSLEALRDDLDTLPNDIALVFLACHGTIAKDAKALDEVRLANPDAEVRVVDLEGLKAPETRPALLLNACFSARQRVSGFADLFLRAFSHSFLGTMGQVDDKVAGKVGAEFVKAALSPEGVNVASFLFHLRRDAAANVKKGGHFEFVHRFMYVYYGSLGDKVRLQRARPRDEDT
jgi:hypothetical protein